MRDTSFLQPLSVKDVIWLNVESALSRARTARVEREKLEYWSERAGELFLAVMDNREVQRDTNLYVKVAALKGNEHPHIKPFDFDSFPSVKAAKEKERRKALKEGTRSRALTPDERLAEIRRREAEEGDSDLTKRMWMHMEHVKSVERQTGPAQSAHAVRKDSPTQAL